MPSEGAEVAGDGAPLAALTGEALTGVEDRGGGVAGVGAEQVVGGAVVGADQDPAGVGAVGVDPGVEAQLSGGGLTTPLTTTTGATTPPVARDCVGDGPTDDVGPVVIPPVAKRVVSRPKTFATSPNAEPMLVDSAPSAR